MTDFRYKAIRVRQTDSGDWLVLFAASAVEINIWSGVPQKKTIGTKETTGFQREENKKRIKEISSFYENQQNIIQNPLLCALRKHDSNKIQFEPMNDNENNNNFIQHGYLTITAEALERLSLLELLKRIKADLEHRVPELLNQEIPDSLVKDLKQSVNINHSIKDNLDDEIDDEQDIETSDGDEQIGTSLSDDSYISDFWGEIAACINVLEEIKSKDIEDSFLGYSKEALISFLRPIVVVDGQHRLRAAVKSAKETVNKENKYKAQIEKILSNEDRDPDEVQRQVETIAARKLPVSLLMNTDPAEQVFQFVVVNQKATPIKPALLGTIVSTSLSNNELERVSDRLENAGIMLEDSRAVTFLVKYKESPFYELVKRGLNSDKKEDLDWRVLASIVKIFRDLKGGKLFHESVDYADKWKRTCLDSSGIVEEWQNNNFDSPYEYWRSLDGCWSKVFIKFWSVVRDELSDKDDDQAWHYWGNPKKSNIFNKTSLTILAADFFQYLCERRVGIDDISHVETHIGQWLEDVNRNYFNKDWNLHNVKKDLTGIRKQWSKLWVEYRKDPRSLPRVNQYGIPLR